MEWIQIVYGYRKLSSMSQKKQQHIWGSEQRGMKNLLIRWC